MKNNLKEIFITAGLILIGLILLNPLDLFMSSMFVMFVLAMLLILFGIFAGFILREKSIDERDTLHRALAGRNAFLVGLGVLTFAIFIQEYNHNLDPWLVIALISMIVTKVLTRFYTDKNL